MQLQDEGLEKQKQDFHAGSPLISAPPIGCLSDIASLFMCSLANTPYTSESFLNVGADEPGREFKRSVGPRWYHQCLLVGGQVGKEVVPLRCSPSGSPLLVLLTLSLWDFVLCHS